MKRRRISNVFAVLAIILSFFNIAEADVIVSKETVYGTVVDQKKRPVPGAKVEILGQSAYAFTDLDGRFSIKCASDAKYVVVRFSKLPDVLKEIKPDMTIRLELGVISAPEHYQWFIGAGLGMGFIDPKDDASQSYHRHKQYNGVNISIMTGRVKYIGWYAKYQLSASSNFLVHGPTLGGIFRLGSPLYLYVGGGLAMTEFKFLDDENSRHFHTGGLLDLGLLFRVQEKIGIGLNGNIVLPTSYSNTNFAFGFAFNYFL